jgi:hypothetical protein
MVSSSYLSKSEFGFDSLFQNLFGGVQAWTTFIGAVLPKIFDYPFDSLINRRRVR